MCNLEDDAHNWNGEASRINRENNSKNRKPQSRTTIHALNKIGEVLNCNLNEQKRKDMTKKQRRLNIFLIAISILIVLEFLMGWLTWEHHWWVLAAWFFPLLGGVSIPYFKKK